MPEDEAQLELVTEWAIVADRQHHIDLEFLRHGSRTACSATDAHCVQGERLEEGEGFSLGRDTPGEEEEVGFATGPSIAVSQQEQ